MDQPQQIDYSIVLADLEAKREKLDAAIAAVREILGQTQPPQSAGTSPRPSPSTRAAPVLPDGEIASDAFFKMSVPDAAKKYLAMVKRPCGTKEIVDALERGGYVHHSENFYTTVHSSLLRREKQVGDLCRHKRKWALLEWYGHKSDGTAGGRKS